MKSVLPLGTQMPAGTDRLEPSVRTRLTDVPDAKAADGGIEKVLEEGGYQLTIRLQPAGEGDYTIGQWTLEKKWEEKETIDGLWQGF